MPSRVRFQTEYNSSFKAPSIEVLKTARSPILKPRPALESIYLNEQPVVDAGLKSSDVHISREPPLQHKKILKNARNPNFETEAAKAKSRAGTKDQQMSKSNVNPILKYANEVDQARSKDDSDIPKAANKRDLSSSEDKIAGRESDNIRYLALEPPMQRKRRPPYMFNHNILRTGTIEYPNGTSAHDEDMTKSETSHTTEEKMQQSPENVRKKLHFEKPAPKAETVDKILPAKASESKNQKQPVRNDESSDKKEDSENKSKKKKLSPTKEQRKRDLRDFKKKQNERVDRSLQIKAKLQNIQPPLYSQPVTTEYRREFSWKEPMKRELRYVIPISDISKDDESQHGVERGAKKHKPFRTEYQLQFKQYSPSKESQFEPRNAAGVDGQDRNEESGNVPEKRSLHHSKNVQPVFFPHGSRSSSETEYKANFVAPSNIQQKVAWQEPSTSHQATGSDGRKVDSTEWFKEVLRLREKAQRYKERARETHYPTVFLASVEEDDSSSDGGLGPPLQEEPINKESNGPEKNATSKVPVNSTKEQKGECSKISTKDLQKSNQKICNETEVPISNEIFKEQKGAESSRDSATSIAKSIASDVPAASERRKRNYNNNNKPKQNGSNIQLQNEQTQTTLELERESRTVSPASTVSSESDESITNVLKGRLDTARIRSSVDHRRHHLDRTTPLRGGAATAPSSKLSGDISAPVHEFRTINQDVKLRHRQSLENEGNFRRGDSWKDAKIVRETKPSAVVTGKTYRHDKYKDEEHRGDLLLSDLEEKELNPERSIQSRKHASQTMHPPRAFVRPSRHDQMHRFDDSDVLSDTSMSARDSIISDVLERSRRRRDEFW